MSKDYIKVKFLKGHPRFSYAAGEIGMIKKTSIKALNLDIDKYIEIVKDQEDTETTVAKKHRLKLSKGK